MQSVEPLKMSGSPQAISLANGGGSSSEPSLEQKKQEFEAMLKQDLPTTMEDVNKMAVKNILTDMRYREAIHEDAMRETSDAYKDNPNS